jgi:hypothetical protein
MFPYRNSVKKYRGQLISVFFCVPAIPLDDALSLPESESKVVNKFDNLPNFAIL